jgi:AcrR family transcriptional regulator
MHTMFNKHRRLRQSPQVDSLGDMPEPDVPEPDMAADAPFVAPARPGRRLTRAEQQQARRDLLLAAAWDVIAETGWKQLSMEQVAERAGLSRRPIYTIFGSREDLLLGLFERLTVQNADSLTQLKPSDCLRRTLAAYAKFTNEQRHQRRHRIEHELAAAVRFHALSDPNTQQRITKINAVVFDRFNCWLEDCTATADESFPLPVERVSRALGSAVFGVNSLWLVSPELIPDTVVTDAIMAFAPACAH